MARVTFPGKRSPVRVRRPSRQRPDQAAGEVTASEDEEVLTGYIQGKKASDIEERAYRAGRRNGDVTGYEPQPSYGPGMNLPGEIRPDALITARGTTYPVWYDGQYWHRSPEQKEKDRFQVSELDKLLNGTGAYLGQRVPDTDLESAAAADEAIRNILNGFYVGLL